MTSLFRLHVPAVLFVGAAWLFSPTIVSGQSLTGALIGTVKDADGGVLRGALVRLTSPALIGGQQTIVTNEKGQLRFPILPPGDYALDIEGFLKARRHRSSNASHRPVTARGSVTR